MHCAGAGVCIFAFVYYDPHNARHVHEIDEATAMPQAIRLMLQLAAFLAEPSI